MRIMFLVHQYVPSHVGGTEIYTRSVALGLSQRGHETCVVHREAGPGVGFEYGGEQSALTIAMWSGTSSPSARFLSTFSDKGLERAFSMVLEQQRPDLVHIQHLMGFPVACAQQLYEHKIPVVITLHDYWWICANAQLFTNYGKELCQGPLAYLNCACCALARHAGWPSGPSGRDWWQWPTIPAVATLMAWRGRRLRSVLSQASRLIAPSRFVKEWYCSQGLPQARIQLLPHGLDPSGPVRAHAQPGVLRLACIGGLSFQKGVHVLVEAMGGVKGVELSIAGDEAFDPVYVAQLRALASTNVRFLGRLDRQQVGELLSRVDAVAVPSLWPETFSLIVHEAFAAGKVVLASRIGALCDAVQDGENGLLLTPDNVAAWRDGVQRLVDEPALLLHLRENVRSPAGMQAHLERLEEIYSECLSERNSSSHFR